MSSLCRECEGAGQKSVSRVDGSGGFLSIVTENVTCKACGGKGEVVVTARPKASNGYEQAARERKAWHLYDAARRLSVGAADIADAEIRQNVLTCARLDGAMKDPSEATWSIVAKHLDSETGDAA